MASRLPGPALNDLGFRVDDACSPNRKSNPRTPSQSAWSSFCESQITLHQRNAVRVIREEFGEDFLYKNKKNRWAIDRRVLKAFNRLTGDGIVWAAKHAKVAPSKAARQTGTNAALTRSPTCVATIWPQAPGPPPSFRRASDDHA